MELNGINTLIALQESERMQAIALGFPGDRIEIVPNGIDPSEKLNVQVKGSFRKHFGIDPLKPLILFLGRINKVKGTDMLVEAFSRLKHLDAQLAIVGPDDGQLEEVKDLIQKYGLHSKVFITGLLSGTDVLSAFQDADLFVLPCRSDTFPVTILESCLMDVPMVITDRCENAHMVKEKVAEVVPFDVQAFASSIELLLSDQERYNRYKSNCSKLVYDTFSIQAVVDRLEAIYQRIVSEKIN